MFVRDLAGCCWCCGDCCGFDVTDGAGFGNIDTRFWLAARILRSGSVDLICCTCGGLVGGFGRLSVVLLACCFWFGLGWFLCL